MKKLLLFLAFITATIAASAQTSVRMTSETVGFFTITADTMQIVKADQIVKASVYCPSFATDSVHISGCTFTLLDGHTTNGIIVPPGEATINVGFDYAYSDTLTIDADDKAFIMLLKKR